MLYEKCEKFKVDFKSRHNYTNEHGQKAGLLLLLTLSRHRVSAVKNHLSNFISVSFCLVKAVNKVAECYRLMCNLPFTLEEQSKEGIFSYEFEKNEKPESVSWNQIADFAVRHQIDDPMLIMAHYLDFAAPFPCKKCYGKGLKPHGDHEKEHKNAKLFYEAKAQKNISQQAADVVVAKRRLRLLELSRSELLADKFKKQLERLKELGPIQLLQHMAGVAWYAELIPQFHETVLKILQLFVENVPKKRNCLFIGPVNSGKTTVAAALLELLEAKALNVNCPADKLPFELGCAIDHFAVIFEDVKGQVSLNKGLQPGQGINNLDNLREHLDGAVPVNLEKKHVNKRTQIFPPCIVTANEYVFPCTLKARFAETVTFQIKQHLKLSLDKNEDLGKHRILQSGLTVFLSLLWNFSPSYFSESIREDIVLWKSILESEITGEKFAQIQMNVAEGEDPLKGIVIYEDDCESDQDSGRFTQ